ncbi:peptidyl-tRNA hydrolase [Agrobacterium phage Atu_ph07]|uniref:peptidyl-tRNA hydrolase n=1 Tax=Agrobacterium phage Atu_ph07 TaxID=2024264 RepID=A0A223W0C3_9CAUD|nr:peptidyl-tRNA hydrolase [Agrobacterium phage Atu_ph07]ASV44756.1 peptidyl-tRNA hydrolase [Agrobacterium phage Atu_ph07]
MDIDGLIKFSMMVLMLIGFYHIGNLVFEKIDAFLDRFRNLYYKQIIVVRKDLNMRKGKIAAQVSHASQLTYIKYGDDYRVKRWLRGPFTKICVSVDSEEEFFEIERKAIEAGLLVSAIQDAGKTEFKGVPTWTAMAIGPDIDKNLEPITGDLKLL